MELVIDFETQAELLKKVLQLGLPIVIDEERDQPEEGSSDAQESAPPAKTGRKSAKKTASQIAAEARAAKPPTEIAPPANSSPAPATTNPPTLTVVAKTAEPAVAAPAAPTRVDCVKALQAVQSTFESLYPGKGAGYARALVYSFGPEVRNIKELPEVSFAAFIEKAKDMADNGTTTLTPVEAA